MALNETTKHIKKKNNKYKIFVLLQHKFEIKHRKICFDSIINTICIYYKKHTKQLLKLFINSASRY